MIVPPVLSADRGSTSSLLWSYQGHHCNACRLPSSSRASMPCIYFIAPRPSRRYSRTTIYLAPAHHHILPVDDVPHHPTYHLPTMYYVGGIFFWWICYSSISIPHLIPGILQQYCMSVPYLSICMDIPLFPSAVLWFGQLAHIAAYPAYVVGLWAGLVINCFGCEAAKSETNVWKFSTSQRIIYMTFKEERKKKRSALI